MSCPHPVAFRQELSFTQIRRLWYMFFYQSPFIPELAFQADDFAIFQRHFHAKPAEMINKYLITDDDIEVFKYTFSQKGKN
jgi:hypothetical protein